METGLKEYFRGLVTFFFQGLCSKLNKQTSVQIRVSYDFSNLGEYATSSEKIKNSTVFNYKNGLTSLDKTSLQNLKKMSHTSLRKLQTVLIYISRKS